MISKELLEILVCPETHQAVMPADAALIGRLNERILKGELKNRAQEKVTEKLDGGIVREDGKVLYAVRGGIPVMLIEEAIPLT
jgi:uncharacterized protein YbaR (Trm112 family)